MDFVRQGFCFVGLVVCLLLGSNVVIAAQKVQVAAVHFPPYVIKPETGVPQGLLVELVAALNQVQGDYQFVLRPTSLNRRFNDLQQGRIDLAIFENPDWQWQGIAGTRIDMGLEDAEIFVARALPGRSQAYFENLMGKRMALFNGYHYGFAGFNNDPVWLAKNFQAQLTYSHESNLNMVLRGRVDVAPITRSWIGAYLRDNPELRSQLLISEWVDQVYRHYVILRPQAPISGERFRELMQQLRENGQLEQIFAPYGIAVRPRVAGSSTATSATD
ncbi:transporter substrate-binding domain-containing protein [Aquipseudomonas campi]|uniref:Transporter substrate-binding domain-containing protein n=1 Tax=Aquipseudomonas campi TaxID=2731681 RepID=A0A6M8FHX8_9GAMM|nr:transporter substrate-binding domain-containing protein [Pseudomonas campi]QKE63670.1 transporter substrate-binding domain-containing protein [Pseudomonas campi]